jgi:hypothetical protein
LYVVVMLTALIGFVSMAVDVGRVRLARSELQTATDASARAAADSLPISTQTVINNATDAAASNGIIDAADDGTHERTNTGLVIEPDDDLVFGMWNPDDRSFSPIDNAGGTNRDERRSANAVRIIGRRIKERDSAIPLIFAPVVGVFSSDIERDATAYISGGPVNFGFIGLDSISATGAVIDSMVYGQSGTGGGVASDGDISLGTSDVYGDARAGADPADHLTGGNVVTGWTANLDYTLAPKFSNVTTPPRTQTFNPPNNGDWILPPTGSTPSNNPQNPRTYRVDGIDLIGGRNIRVRGFVTLYVEGDINAGSNSQIVNTTGTPTPANFHMIVPGTHNVTLGGRAKQYMHLYAPRSTVTIRSGRSGGGFYGWIIARRLTLQSGALLHYDETRNEEKNYKITLVR